MDRRCFVRLGALTALTAAAAGRSAARAAEPRRIAVVARKFAFVPAAIRARAGDTLVIELTAADFVHGFAVPELGARIDVPPGRSVELVLKAVPVGRYTVLCDNFCGEEHDRMTGVLEVSPAPG